MQLCVRIYIGEILLKSKKLWGKTVILLEHSMFTLAVMSLSFFFSQAKSAAVSIEEILHLNL